VQAKTLTTPKKKNHKGRPPKEIKRYNGTSILDEEGTLKNCHEERQIRGRPRQGKRIEKKAMPSYFSGNKGESFFPRKRGLNHLRGRGYMGGGCNQAKKAPEGTWKEVGLSLGRRFLRV